MRIKYILINVIVLMLLFSSQLKGQESGEDAVLIKNIPEKNNLQWVQPFFVPYKLEFKDEHKDLQIIFYDQKNEIFNANHMMKYYNNIAEDSFVWSFPKYPGLADYKNYGGTLGSFNLFNKISLDYGAFISEQYAYLFSSKQIVFGGNLFLRYDISNKLQFQAWGQYVSPGNSPDPAFNMPFVFPATKFGTGLQYNSNDKSEIKVGVEYQYNSDDKTWKPQSGGKVLFKF